jgi:ketosteroid isomerase-like protein
MKQLSGLLIAVATGISCGPGKKESVTQNHSNSATMSHNNNNDSLQLSTLNARFINNFVTQNVTAHSKLIHPDFVCIESNGHIIDRDTYLKNWATDFDNSGYTAFTHEDESIRIFGDIALVRSKTTYTKPVNGAVTKGHTIYTDTYKKENGEWRCIQVQITPVK